MALFYPQQRTIFSPRLSWSGRWFCVWVLISLTLLSACGEQGHQSTENVFSGVAAVSPGDVWAVGNMSGQDQVLIEHWDGGQWQTVPFSLNGTLSGIAAVAANDVWAVGSSSKSALLTMHWDGTRWSQVPSPNLSSTSNTALLAVAAVSSHDVWAVGQQEGSPVFLHWDGQRWRTVSPDFPPDLHLGSLRSVQAISSTDIWAVGWYSKVGGQYTLVEHWDGQSWRFVPTPDDTRDHRFLGNATFSGLTALSSKNLWAVGETDLSSVYVPRTLVEHWTGSQWKIVDTPPPSGTDSNYPQTIFAANAHDIWIAGYRYSRQTYTNYPLLLHWDGQSWQFATLPALKNVPSVFYAGTVLGATNLWVVGSSGGAISPAPTIGTQVSQTLVEHWDGTRWSRVPSPSPGQPIYIPGG